MIIYLISSEINDSTLYKIGITKRNINKRLTELKTGNPATLTVIHTFKSQYAPKIEKHFHISNAYNNRGENGSNYLNMISITSSPNVI